MKLAVNLIPFPMFRFFVVGYAPVSSRNIEHYGNLSVPDVAEQMFDAKNRICVANLGHGRYLTGSAIFRGQLSTKKVEQTMYNIQTKNPSQFVEWIPSSIKTSICDIDPMDARIAATFIGSSTPIQEIFKRVSEQFQAMFRRKAFIYHYTGEGMDEMDMIEADANVQDFISNY
jgi:tubulin beta